MSLVRDQADWVRLCGVAGLVDGQRILLETVLAACDPATVLTRHVCDSQTLVAAIARVQFALEPRARPGRKIAQPFVQLTYSLVSAALATFRSRKALFSAGALDDAIRELEAIDARGEAGLKNPADCANVASRLAPRAVGVRAAVIDRFAALWQSQTTAVIAQQVAQEMAALCVVDGRQHAHLAADVRAELSRGSNDVNQLLKVLLPELRNFQVAVVIEGASRLESLTALMDQAAVPMMITDGDRIAGWGRRTADLRALSELAKGASAARGGWMGNQASGYVLLTFTVGARDLRGGALLGRRRVLETLDQYVAEQRVSEIRLRPETLVRDPKIDQALRLAVPSQGASVARPLITGWPVALRESLRTAHIARVTESPMAAAGLSWAALEALEVKPKGKGVGVVELARALSLQALRQQVVELHQRMRTGSSAVVRAARNANGSKKASAGHLSVELERAPEVEKHRAAVDAWIGAKEQEQLRDLNRWLDVLAAPASSPVGPQVAAAALTDLIDILDGELSAGLQTWRTLLTSPPLLAAWIVEGAARFDHHLNWLYALRNTALHDGQFTSSTDVLDAHSGHALVDLTLEFLGNWYEQASKTVPDRAKWTAIDVIEHLSERQKAVVAKLCAGSRAGLNATYLTSPTSTGWDRT